MEYTNYQLEIIQENTLYILKKKKQAKLCSQDKTKVKTRAGDEKVSKPLNIHVEAKGPRGGRRGKMCNF